MPHGRQPTLCCVAEHHIAVGTALLRTGMPVAYPGILFGGGFKKIQLRTEDRENWDMGDGGPLVRGSGGSCNLVQEISFHIVKFS